METTRRTGRKKGTDMRQLASWRMPLEAGARIRIAVAAACAILATVVLPNGLVGQDGGSGAIGLERLLELGSAVGGETPQWSPNGSSILYLSGHGGLATVAAAGGANRPVPVLLGGAGHFLASQDPRWSPDGKWISFISDKAGADELWIWSVRSGAERQLTHLGGRLIRGYAWSPDGSSVAVSTDRHGNMDIWTVRVSDGRVTRITSSPRYEVEPAWTPDGTSVIYVRLDDAWTEHAIVEKPVSGGEPQTITTDTDFFDYSFGGKFGQPQVSPDGRQILFPSQRSGWINYWVVDRSGGSPRPLAPEEAEQGHARWSPDGTRVAFTSNDNGTSVLKVVGASGGSSPRTVAAPDGMGAISNPEWSPDGKRLSYTLETPTRFRDLWIADVGGGSSRQLTVSTPEGDLSSRLVAPEKVSFTSEDGLEIHAYLYRPPGARQGAKVPAIMWIHGGPTGQWRDTYQQAVQFFVQRGYAVLMPNIRGSSGYGKAFEEANDGCWGHCDLKDVEAGARFLRSLPYVDPQKLAITGTSYGGVMTMDVVAFGPPGLFQAAVSQSGYCDWVTFMGNFNELRHRKLLEHEFGPFPQNEDVYRANSAITGAANATTPIFIVHGEGHYPGSPQSWYFAGALQEHYKVFRYKAYPGETYYVYSRDNRKALLQDTKSFLDYYLSGVGDDLPGKPSVPESAGG